MLDLPHYFSAEHGAAFARAIPSLRKGIGIRAFEPMGTNYGIAGNTFRAYRGCREKPSLVYRSWAEDACGRLNANALEAQLATQDSFDDWHRSLSTSLERHWRKRQAQGLSLAHRHKLVDLFVKWLSSHDFGSPRVSEGLVSHANCALDSQTLRTLNECLSLALPLSAPSMGHVHSQHTYVFCQMLIGSFAVHFGGSRLLFDYYAWKRGGSGKDKGRK